MVLFNNSMTKSAYIIKNVKNTFLFFLIGSLSSGL